MRCRGLGVVDGEMFVRKWRGWLIKVSGNFKLIVVVRLFLSKRLMKNFVR